MKFRNSKDGELIERKDYSKKIIFNLSDFNNTGHLLQVVTIPPNTKQRLHSHNIQTEVFYILEGETIITINGKDFLARPGDAFICEPGDIHNLWNKTDQDLKLVVFKINMLDGDDDTNWQE